MYLNLFGECGAEHEGLPLSSWWHVVLLHNATDLGLKSHVQHPVSLVKDQEPKLKWLI